MDKGRGGTDGASEREADNNAREGGWDDFREMKHLECAERHRRKKI